MRTLRFKCTLKTDVILNVKSATEGNNETLDFIPGNNFLGVVAGNLYNGISSDEAMTLFHSGKVRFGDAHPSISGNNQRSLRIPASMFYPKMKKVTDICYLHHFYERDKDKNDNGGPQQLKQCRSGFYAFADNEATPAQIEKSFAIKSAYDREKRRSKDEAMYGYESLDKGAEFYFSVEVDDDGMVSKIEEAIKGIKRIGRSRTAQYGLVEIEECDFKESESRRKTGDFVTIYADSRLIFLDDNGNLTFRPSITQLGLTNGEICWEKSQIRTFQYAPWNFKRQCYDTDRCGIEKGSVFVIKGCTDTNFSSKHIGSYQNEGFGKVIYNPDFLEEKGENGKALYAIKDANEQKQEWKGNLEGDVLLEYLARQIKESSQEASVYKMVNEFVRKYAATVEEKKEDPSRMNIFTSENFASQWGTIRSIAMQSKTKNDLEIELFTKTMEKSITKNGETKKVKIDNAYLTHGVAKDKWEEKGRINKFKNFFEGLTDENAQTAIINLAAQMAKRCRNNGK